MTVRNFIERMKILLSNSHYSITLWKDSNTDLMWLFINNEDERKQALEKASQYLDCEVISYSLGYDSIGLTIKL